MDKEFIMTPVFDRIWKELALTEEDLMDLQNIIMENPQAGTPLEGAPNVRKMRYAINNKGKSGGLRVFYIHFVIKEIIVLLLAYPKSKKTNLSQSETNMLNKYAKEIERSL